jgi:cysteine desulfurase/selenocysteine lyase
MMRTMENTMKINSGTNTYYDVNLIREDFPILHQKVHGNILVYLDNAATTQKPKTVIESLSNFYLNDNANVHRGAYSLSERATEAYEGVRRKVQQFINARSNREIVFTRGTTEAINLVASSYGQSQLKKGDDILITEMEHHSNIVPWQLLCQKIGAQLKVIPIDDRGQLILEEFEHLVTERTKLLALCHVSNSLGTINPVKDMIKEAHKRGIPVLLDGAQATAHVKVDVQELDVDFYTFSSHKMFGPTGVGVLYAKERLLEAMPPYQSGGDMITMVTFEKTQYNELPYKFEAGTPNISGVVGFGAALDYVTKIGFDLLTSYDQKVLSYATERAEAVSSLRLIGTAREKVSILSFVVDGIHPHDLGTLLDRQGIAIRTGHHCAMPVVDHFKVPATARASFTIYNTVEEVDRLFEGIEKARKVFL